MNSAASKPATPGDNRPPVAPGDEAPAGTPGTGEDVCPVCGGSGSDERGAPCSHCEGSGKVIVGIGGG